MGQCHGLTMTGKEDEQAIVRPSRTQAIVEHVLDALPSCLRVEQEEDAF